MPASSRFLMHCLTDSEELHLIKVQFAFAFTLDRARNTLSHTHNPITGKLPSNIGRLVNLKYLDMVHMEITGPLPESVGELTELTGLDMSYNKLSGVHVRLCVRVCVQVCVCMCVSAWVRERETS